MTTTNAADTRPPRRSVSPRTTTGGGGIERLRSSHATKRPPEEEEDPGVDVEPVNFWSAMDEEGERDPLPLPPTMREGCGPTDESE